jgi:phage anti-repressor protein
MKITDFLKKYSLIDCKFIDDFYSFYNEGQNEYDFAINLDNIAFWLEMRKDNLKRLLETNFVKNQDYIETKPEVKLQGTGTNNIKIVMLTYTCSKLLCMISKCEKAGLIRNYYIELEKLLIKYKDDIDENINRQLGIKIKNKEIIEQNKQHALIYILKVDDEVYKIGKTTELKNRMKQYKVGRISELPIVFVYKTDQINDIEKCMKDNLAKYQLQNKTELYKIDLDFVKETITYCTKKNAILLKRNKKLYEANDNKNWLIIIDKQNIDNIDQLFKQVKRYKKKTPKQSKQSKQSNSNSIAFTSPLLKT